MSHTLIETTLRMPRVCAGLALNAATPAFAAYGGGLHLWRLSVAAPMLAATWPTRSVARATAAAAAAPTQAAPAKPGAEAKAAAAPAAKPKAKKAKVKPTTPAAAKAAAPAKPKTAPRKQAATPARAKAAQPAKPAAPAKVKAATPAKPAAPAQAKPAPKAASPVQSTPATPAPAPAKAETPKTASPVQAKEPKPVTAAATATPAASTPAAAPAKPDDLTRIKGVGPKLAEQLGALGVTRFEQIASWTGPQIDRFEDKLDGPAGRIRRDDWIGQARALSGLDEAPKTARPSTTTYRAPNKAGRSGSVTLPAMPDGTARKDA